MNPVNEHMFLMALLSDFLNKKKTAYAPENLNWAEICRLAKNHEVQGIVFYQCKELLKGNCDTTEAYNELNKAYLHTVYQAKQRENAYSKIKEEFKREGIKFFAVKGESIAELYPVPMLRTMGDVDLVLSVEDRKKAHQIMLETGYSCLYKDDAEWGYKKNGIEFELHDKLEYELLAEHNAFFNDFRQYVECCDGGLKLNDSFHFLYLILHLRKHLLSFGVGIRHFVDIVVMAQRGTIDWRWVGEQLEKNKLSEFTKTCFGLCCRWFGFVPPFEYTAIDDDFYNSATEIVLKNGVFGFNNEENRNVTVNSAAKSNAIESASLRQTMIKRTLNMYLPGYKTMCAAEHYSFLRGRPYLLPVAWGYRLYRGIKLKKMREIGRFSDEMRISQESQEEIEQRTAWLKMWKI